MMTYKQYYPKAFASFDKFGISVSSFSEALPKFKIGMAIGGGNLTNVLFGLYSLSLVNIPL